MTLAMRQLTDRKPAMQRRRRRPLQKANKGEQAPLAERPASLTAARS
jgi:hypothetical protein